MSKTKRRRRVRDLSPLLIVCRTSSVDLFYNVRYHALRLRDAAKRRVSR